MCLPITEQITFGNLQFVFAEPTVRYLSNADINVCLKNNDVLKITKLFKSKTKKKVSK